MCIRDRSLVQHTQRNENGYLLNQFLLDVRQQFHGGYLQLQLILDVYKRQVICGTVSSEMTSTMPTMRRHATMVSAMTVSYTHLA